jgi:hypothetical protein
MYINNYLSLQKKRYSFPIKKKSLAIPYFHDLRTLYCCRRTRAIAAARKLFKYQDELDFQYLEDIYGMQK